METRRRHADKGGDAGDARVGEEYLLQRVGSRRSLFHRCGGIEVHLDGEAVALGLGENLDIDGKGKDHCQHHGSDTHGESGPLVAEAEPQELLISMLQTIEELLLNFLESCLLVGIGGLDEVGRHIGNDQHGIEETASQRDKDCPWEEFDEVAKEGSLEDRQSGEEHQGDGGRSEKH